MQFNPNIFNSGVFNTQSMTRVFNRNVFGSPPLFNTGEDAEPSFRGHLVRRNRGKARKINWEELERLSQQQVEERAAELLQEELLIQEEKQQAKRWTQKDHPFSKKIAIYEQIEEIKQYEIFLRQQQKLLFQQLAQLQDEEDIISILMLI